MLVFVDESGDSGFKIASSKYFIIALVIFDDYEEADEARLIIKAVMKRVRQKPEFKFSKCKDDRKDEFFKAVRKCNFRIRYICFDKKKIYDDQLRRNSTKFYNYALKTVISNSGLDKAKIQYYVANTPCDLTTFHP